MQESGAFELGFGRGLAGAEQQEVERLDHVFDERFQAAAPPAVAELAHQLVE